MLRNSPFAGRIDGFENDSARGEAATSDEKRSDHSASFVLSYFYIKFSLNEVIFGMKCFT